MRRLVAAAAAAAAAAALAVLVVLALALREDGDRQAPRGRGGPLAPERFVVGTGTRAAVVMRPRGAGRGRPVVVFLHGWTANDPDRYAAWLRHLVLGGADVVFPIYQRPPFDDVRNPLADAQAALRAAFARLPGHGPVLVVGHSAGGALASDYAASATEAGLPPPEAVYAVYPGRDLGPGRQLTGPPLSRIPAGTRLLVLASPTDAVVGTATARAIVAGATQVRGRLRTIDDPDVGEHNAPARSSPRDRATFWAPLDRLVDEVDAEGDR